MVSGYRLTVRLNLDESGRKVEDLQVSMSPPGSPLGVSMETVCEAVNVGLRRGVPLSAYLHQWRGQKFAPCGKTTDPLVDECTSLVDYLAKAISLRV